MKNPSIYAAIREQLTTAYGLVLQSLLSISPSELLLLAVLTVVSVEFDFYNSSLLYHRTHDQRVVMRFVTILPYWELLDLYVLEV